MTSERIYRILLKAYPRRYRERYGEPMAQLFRDQLRAANTFGKWARLWLRTVVDLALTVPARYFDRWPWAHPMLLNYSQHAMRAIFFARYVAASGNDSEITLEHLLLGTLRENHGLACQLVGRGGYDVISQAIGRETIPISRDGRRRIAQLPLSIASKKALETAYNRARAASTKVTPQHLLAAILDQPESLAARLLRSHAVDLSRVENRSEF